MKKIVSLLSICLVFVCCVVITGCSCSSPMNVSYSISTGNGINMEVRAIVTKKFREPVGTPCYKKVNGGKDIYSKLDTSEEIQACFEGKIKCYRKEGLIKPKYIEITDMLELNRCEDEYDCYEQSAVTYYKLLENPEGISECYNAEGEPFERATYGKAEKVELDNRIAIYPLMNRYMYDSSVEQVPSNANYSLIYEFNVENKEEKTMYIEAIEYEDVTQGIVKEQSAEKVKLTLPTNRVFKNNKFYYVLSAGSTISIKVEVKNLLTSDSAKKKTKELQLIIPLNVIYQ